MHKRLLFTTLLTIGLVLGCGGKKSDVSGADDVNGTDPDADTTGTTSTGAGMEAEASTGPVSYPQAVSSSGSRTPYRFNVSIERAYVLPLSADGKCFDPCTKEVKQSLIDGLPGLAGEQFGSAAKALSTQVGAKGGSASLPDIYVNLNCVGGQEIRTHKTSQEDRLVASWRGVSGVIELDKDDKCAISVWDADDDGQDERIGDTTANLIAAAKDGVAIISSEDYDFGQVFMVQIKLEQLEGPSLVGAASGSSASASGTTGSSGSAGQSGSTGGGASAAPEPGKTVYTVEIVKVNVAEKKKDGNPWDTKLPFVGKAGDEAPDPFVRAYVNGYQSENPFLSTEAAANTTFAEWHLRGDVQLSPSDKIHFFVWDKDKVDHDLVGECVSDPAGALEIGREITLKGCGQVDFLVFKIFRQS